MVKVEQHKQRMKEILEKAEQSKGKTKQQLFKHYHRLQKQLNQCNMYLNKQKEVNIKWQDQNSKLTMT